jgi:formylglycine-generating enzyme required for sulfatase activity
MVPVPGNPFCIDTTEVTNAQYNDFLMAGADAGSVALAPQPTECSWNHSYLPNDGAWTYDPSQKNLPIVNVDWCDAYAFCQWAGKRLCGKPGGGGADFSNFDSTHTEHYIACSKNGTQTYPYGNTFDPTACNGLELDAGHTLPVGSLPRCVGGVPGLFDMSGNVEEWQDACQGDAGSGDLCLDGTGSFMFGSTECDFEDNDSRNMLRPDIGIRCCATL